MWSEEDWSGEGWSGRVRGKWRHRVVCRRRRAATRACSHPHPHTSIAPHSHIGVTLMQTKVLQSHTSLRPKTPLRRNLSL